MVINGKDCDRVWTARDRWQMRLNDTGDFAECDWIVLREGKVVAGFAGSNAAERFIADQQAKAAIDKEIARARRTTRVSNAEARRIHLLLRGGR